MGGGCTGWAAVLGALQRGMAGSRPAPLAASSAHRCSLPRPSPCPRPRPRRLSWFYKHESCGQCTPCREGSGWLWDILTRVQTGEADVKEIDMAINISKVRVGGPWPGLQEPAGTLPAMARRMQAGCCCLRRAVCRVAHPCAHPPAPPRPCRSLRATRSARWATPRPGPCRASFATSGGAAGQRRAGPGAARARTGGPPAPTTLVAHPHPPTRPRPVNPTASTGPWWRRGYGSGSACAAPTSCPRWRTCTASRTTARA